jgi:hypothetical protein
VAGTSEYAAFTLVFIAAAAVIWSVMFAVNWWFAVRKTRQADRMRAVDGILNSVGARYVHLTGKASAGSHWTVDARYDYTVAGQPYAGEHFALEFNSWYPDERAALSVASRFRPGERVTVWYDPDSPATAVLDKTPPSRRIYYRNFALVAAGVATVATVAAAVVIMNMS